jgi:hypothetical protein
MSPKVNLQIPIPLELKEKMEKVAQKKGFSTLQEYLRVYMTGAVEGVDDIDEWLLSNERFEEYERNRIELAEDIKSGKAKVYEDVDEFIQALKTS